MTVTLLQGDCLAVMRGMEDKAVQCIVTSPPYYGLRKYIDDNDPEKVYEIGLEETPDEYVSKLVAVFRECRRVLKPDGTLWLNLGDSYASMKSRYNQGAQSINGKPQDNEFKGNKTDLYHHKELGLKDKDLIGIPWMVAFALRADGWYLRQDIIWAKPNPMPESVKDRCTKSHEYIFLLSKSQKYYYDYEAILEPAAFDGRNDTQFKGSEKYKDSGQTFAERGHERWPRKMSNTNTGGGGQGFAKNSGGYDMNTGEWLGPNIDGVPARNKRDVWTVTTKPYKEAHFATFPPDLIEPCILAGSRPGDIVLDPFNGSGTTGAVAIKHHRDYIGIELNPKYITLTEKRLSQVQPVML